jgi:hypothetical protein
LKGATDVGAVGVEVCMRKVACLVRGFVSVKKKKLEKTVGLYTEL